MDYLSTLSSSQMSVVNWHGGPMLLLASPGSGKTTTLVARIAYLARRASSASSRILCLTQSRMSRMQIQNLLSALVPEVQDRVLITSFNLFAVDILRQHGSHFGLSSDFEILPHSERIDLVRSVLAGENDEFTKFISAERALGAINSLLRSGTGDEDVAFFLKDAEAAEQLRVIFRSYKELAIAQNCLDFDLALYFCVQLMRERSRISEQLQAVYRHVCVDDFQNMTPVQYQFLRVLAPRRDADIFLAGDDDQSMFQWLGASSTPIDDLRKDYDLSVLQLPQNFRAPEEIVSLANALIAKNTERFPEKLKMQSMIRTPQTGAHPVELLRFPDDDQEVIGVARRIQRLLAEGKIPSEIAVLSRTTRHLKFVQEELNKLSLANHRLRGKAQFESAPLRFIVSSLKLATVRSDDELASEVVVAIADCFNQGVIVHDLAALSAQLNGDQLEALGVLVASNSSFVVDIRDAVLSLVKGNYAEFIDRTLAYFDGIETPGYDGEELYPEYAGERLIWQGIVEKIGSGNNAHELPLHAFVEQLTRANRDSGMPTDGVRCTTIHASLGLEFRHVFIVGMFEGHFPSLHSKVAGNESRAMQEERRLCFVAITRTRETLTMSFGERQYGRLREPSRFLREMGLLPS